MKKNNILSCVLFILGIIIGILTKFNLLASIDLAFYNMLMQIKCTNVTTIFKFFTMLGSTRFIILLNMILMTFATVFKKKEWLVITVSSLISPIINEILKYIFKRPRPDESYRLITETNYSFPSGHAMISVLFYLTLILTINKSNLKYKRLISYVLLLIIVLIGVSRIYLGVHYFSDVIGGYLIAISIVLIIDKGDKYESINNRS